MSKSKPKPKASTPKPSDKPPKATKPKASPAAGNLVDDLRAAIAGSDLSRYEIARQAEVPESALSYFMSGQRSITLETAAKVARVLGLVLRSAE